jgi:hypothetical protein
MPRQEFSRKVRRERLEYVMANGGLCEGGCGTKLQRGRYEFDHDLEDWEGGKPTFENCRVLCKGPGTMRCHEAKTARKAKERAKSNRIRDKWDGVMGMRPRLQSRGFPKALPQHTATTPPKKQLPHRRLTP